MDRKRAPERIYIAVDSSKVLRCRWCGTAESKSWISGQWCSSECRSADMVCSDFCCFAIFQIIAIEMASILLLQTLPMAISYGLYSLLMLTLLLVSLPELFALVGLHQLLKGMRWRTKVPAHSREDDELQELDILRGIAAVVKCPSCDAALDLNKVYSDMTFTCDYCGATGTIELVKTRHHGRD